MTTKCSKIILLFSNGLKRLCNDQKWFPSGPKSQELLWNGLKHLPQIVPIDYKVVSNGYQMVKKYSNCHKQLCNGSKWMDPDVFRTIPNDSKIVQNDFQMFPNDSRMVPNKSQKMVLKLLQNIPIWLKTGVMWLPNGQKLLKNCSNWLQNGSTWLWNVLNDSQMIPNDS